MRIFDNDANKKLEQVTLFLTKSEVLQLSGYLETLLTDSHHVHLSSEDYQKEITICIYDPKNLNGFDERSKKLILEDA